MNEIKKHSSNVEEELRNSNIDIMEESSSEDPKQPSIQSIASRAARNVKRKGKRVASRMRSELIMREDP
jgi:hypothetical protein